MWTITLRTARDPLTRRYNRRYLEESLNREISRARRAGASIGVIVLDVDNFKQFIDSFGHLMGDELLRALGTYLKSHVRPEDIPSRYRGEEFALILPGASCEIVHDRAETLRKGCKGIHLGLGLGEARFQGTISHSFGVAVFPEHGASAEGVLRAADEALYQAKRRGRDCVVVAANHAWASTQAQPQTQ